MSFSSRVLHMTPAPGPLQGKAADATGYPLTHFFLRQDATPRTSGDLVPCPSRACSLGDSRGTTDTNGQNLTDSAPEHFPAHRPLWAAPLRGGTRRLIILPARHKQTCHHALAGQADLRDGQARASNRTPGRGWALGCGIPVDLLKGYHALPRGQAWHARPVVQ